MLRMGMRCSRRDSPLGADRSLLASADTVGFPGIRYLWIDTDTWADAFVWKD